jgi:hypothetical protein
MDSFAKRVIEGSVVSFGDNELLVVLMMEVLAVLIMSLFSVLSETLAVISAFDAAWATDSCKGKDFLELRL